MENVDQDCPGIPPEESCPLVDHRKFDTCAEREWIGNSFYLLAMLKWLPIRNYINKDYYIKTKKEINKGPCLKIE